MKLNNEELYKRAEEIKKSITELSVYDMNIYSAIELYYSLAKTIREIMIELGIQNDKLIYLLDTGLPTEIGKILDKYKEDGTLDTIINQNIFGELNNQISNCLELIKKEAIDLDNLGNCISMGSLDTEVDYIYPWDKLSLSGTQTWSYYDGTSKPWLYPQCMLDKNGVIHFRGEAKIDTSQPLVFDTDGSGMIHLATLFHFSIEAHEGIPLRGNFVGVNDNDFNDTITIPFMLKPNGKIYVKNMGEEANAKYYSRISLGGASVSLTWRGQQILHENIDSVIKKVLDRGLGMKNLIYFTDIHHSMTHGDRYRRNEQLKAMQKVDSILNVTAIVSGGDNINDQDNKVKGIACHKEIYSSFKKNKFVYTNGNHDINIINGNDNFVHPFNIKPFFNNKYTTFGGDTKYYSYTDFEEAKLRIIAFDTMENDFIKNTTHVAAPYVSDEQINWIKTYAMDMTGKTDWNVLFVGHIPPIDKNIEGDTVLTNRVTIRTLIEDFKFGSGDFAEQGKIKVCGYLCGHEHLDRVTNVNGISYIHCLLAWSTQVNYQNTGEPYQQITRELGTDYEFSFDIISIDDNNRKMYLQRVGRKTNYGDREINY